MMMTLDAALTSYMADRTIFW